MGAEPWECFTPYQSDLKKALRETREREFQAGRYNGGGDSGPLHDSIEEAMEDADADGTGSILDIEEISSVPDNGLEPDCGIAYPFTDQRILELYGTNKPSREMIKSNKRALNEIYRGIGRGSAIYIVLYDGESPTEIFFAGYSYD